MVCLQIVSLVPGTIGSFIVRFVAGEQKVQTILRDLRRVVRSLPSPSIAPFSQANKVSTRLLPLLLLALTMLPSLAWILLDQSVWPWDQAWYGFNSVTLFNSLISSPGDWINDLISACIAQPPGIAWIGQFFVPMARLTGSVDSALLLSILATNFCSLILIYRSILDASQGRRLLSLTAAIFVSSGPLFIAVSHQYFAESIQLLIVSWFVLLMTKARSWPRFRLICHLILACFLAMAAKASSPLYCFLPGLATLIFAFQRSTSPKNGLNDRLRMNRLEKVVLFGGLLMLPFLVVAWYLRNGESMEDHVRVSAFVEHWGARDSFLNKLTFWVDAFQHHFFMRLPLIFTSVVVLIACAVTFFNAVRRRYPHLSFFDLAALISMLQILGPISVFSLVPNEAARYLLPLAPYVALVVAWSLSKLQKPWTLAALVVYTIQLLFIHSEALALAPAQSDSIPWLITVNKDPSISNQLTQIINLTCPVDAAGHSSTIEVAADLRMLNNFTLSYRASTLRSGYLGLRKKPCDYVNSTKQGDSLDPLISSFENSNPAYVVAIKNINNVPAILAPSFTNQVTSAVTPEFLRDHAFQLSSMVKDFLETSVLIYKSK